MSTIMVVKQSDPPHVLAAKVLRDNNYGIANQNGYRVPAPHRDAIGILRDRDPTPALSEHVGTLFLADRERDAQPTRRWVLEVFGRTYETPLRPVAERLEQEGRTNGGMHELQVIMYVAQEDPRRETRLPQT